MIHLHMNVCLCCSTEAVYYFNGLSKLCIRLHIQLLIHTVTSTIPLTKCIYDLRPDVSICSINPLKHSVVFIAW